MRQEHGRGGNETAQRDGGPACAAASRYSLMAVCVIRSAYAASEITLACSSPLVPAGGQSTETVNAVRTPIIHPRQTARGPSWHTPHLITLRIVVAGSASLTRVSHRTDKARPIAPRMEETRPLPQFSGKAVVQCPVATRFRASRIRIGYGSISLRGRNAHAGMWKNPQRCGQSGTSQDNTESLRRQVPAGCSAKRRASRLRTPR